MFSRFGFRRRRHATKAYRVETPEGTTLNYELEKAALGSELLENVLAAVDVQPAERRYFGLAVQEGGFMKWVLPNKQLKKQLAGHPPYLLHLRVHLYPRDHHSLQHYSSRHQLFLQVRRDLQENRLQCNTAMTSQLAALVVQVDVGDFRSSTCGAGYLTEVQALPRLNLQLQETVMQLHRINRGKSKRECEEEFLDLAQEQHSYGSQWYSVQDSSHNPVTLMASPSGLKVLRGPIETAAFEWDSITKMASKGRNLTVHISRTHTLATYNSGFSCASSHMAHHLTRTLLGMQEFYCCGAVDRLEPSRLKRFFSSRRSMRRRNQTARRPLEHPSTNPTPRRSGRGSGTTLSARRSSYSGALDGVLTFQQETNKPTAVNSPPQDNVPPHPPSLDPTSGSALAPTHSRHSSSMDSSALHSRHDSTSLDSFAGTLGDETQAEVKGQPRPQATSTPPGPIAPRLTDFVATPILEESVPIHDDVHGSEITSPQPRAWYDSTTSHPHSHEHRSSTASSHSNPRHDQRSSYDRQLSASSGPHEHQSNSRPYDQHSGSHGYHPRSQNHHSGSHDRSGSYTLSGLHNHSGSYDPSGFHDHHSGSHDHRPGSRDRHSGSHDRLSGSYASHSRAQDHHRGSGSRDHSSWDHHHSGSHDHRRNSGSHDHHRNSGSHDHRRNSGSHDHRRNSGSYDHYSHRSTSQSPSEARGPSPNPFPVPGRPGHAHPSGPVVPPHHQHPRHRPPPLHSVSQPNLDYYRPVHSRPPLPSGRGYNRPSSGGGRSHHRNSPHPSADAPPSHHHNGTHPHIHPSHRRNDIHPHIHPSQYYNGTHHWPIAEDTPSSLPPPPTHNPTRSTPPKEEPWYAPSPPPDSSTPAPQPHFPTTQKSRSLPPGVSLSLSQPPLPEMENMDSIVQFLDDSLGTGSQEDSTPPRPVRTIMAAARPQNRGQFRLSLQDASYYDSKQQSRGQGRLKTIHGSQTILTQGDLESSLKLGSIASMELQMSLAELSQASETCLDPHLRSIVFQSSQSQGTEL